MYRQEMTWSIKVTFFVTDLYILARRFN